MPLSEIDSGDIPQPEEIEIIVFGPGYGECICLHIGSGQWMVVDSCSVSGRYNPIALQYFERLGLDPAEAVKLIVITHWHDDHCKGLATLLKACPSADFFISDAIAHKEFLTFVESYHARGSGASGSQVSEISTIFEYLISENLKLRRVTQGQCLYREDVQKIEITALSPSPAATHAFLCNVADAMPKTIEEAGENDQRVYRSTAFNFSPNEASIAIVVKIDNESIFLGADLENETAIDRGWNAVVGATNIPSFKAGTFKISHHGSLTGYDARIWTQFVNLNAISIITPWKKGKSQLPKEEGLEAISRHTNEIYITAQNHTSKGATGKPSVVHRELESLGMKITKISPTFGAVRLRKKIGSGEEWSIKCFGSSFKYKKAS